MRWRRWDGNDQIAIVTWWRQGGDVVEQRRDGCDSAEVGVTMAIIFFLKMTNNEIELGDLEARRVSRKEKSGRDQS